MYQFVSTPHVKSSSCDGFMMRMVCWILDFDFLAVVVMKNEELDFSLLAPPTRIFYQRKWLTRCIQIYCVISTTWCYVVRKLNDTYLPTYFYVPFAISESGTHVLMISGTMPKTKDA